MHTADNVFISEIKKQNKAAGIFCEIYYNFKSIFVN